METNVNASVKRACKAVGGQRALAIALGIADAQVNQWVTGRRGVPAKYCQSIVELTEGLVSVQELRPADWHLIWPIPKSTEVDLIHENHYDPNEGNDS
jgi:DNA-binding transcriptional regulator YdaS (Cro superfamily)